MQMQRLKQIALSQKGEMRCDEQNFYDSRRSCSGTGSFQVLCL